MSSSNPRGGPSRPSAVKRLEGERPDRINQREPVAADDPPEDFDHFTSEQRALYERVVEDLTYMGLAYRADDRRLVAYVYSEWMQLDCIRRINETGLLVRGSNGEPKANPLIAVRDKADSRATVLAREFGLTPSARQSIRRDLVSPTAKTEPASSTPRQTRAKKKPTGTEPVTNLFG